MQQISAAALLPWLAQQAGAGQPDALLLDVREPWEFALAAIRVDGTTTVNWPMGSIPERAPELDAAQPVVCICHHGMRSAQVVAFLAQAGHPAVYNLAGGIDAWSAEVDPTVPRY